MMTSCKSSRVGLVVAELANEGVDLGAVAPVACEQLDEGEADADDEGAGEDDDGSRGGEAGVDGDGDGSGCEYDDEGCAREPP